MVKILAIEASSQVCSVALSCDASIKQLQSTTPKSHSTQILPLIESLLKNAELQLADLDTIAFGEGPGSFTGLRICLSLAQGLAFGANKSLVAANSLHGMAYSAMDQLELVGASKLIIVNDARMNELYWQIFDVDGSNKLVKPVGETMLGSCEDVNAQIESLYKEDGNYYLLGDGVSFLDEQISENAREVVADFYPEARGTIQVAQERFQQGLTLSVEEAEPLYLRNSVAWNKRKRIRS